MGAIRIELAVKRMLTVGFFASSVAKKTPGRAYQRSLRLFGTFRTSRIRRLIRAFPRLRLVFVQFTLSFLFLLFLFNQIPLTFLILKIRLCQVVTPSEIFFDVKNPRHLFFQGLHPWRIRSGRNANELPSNFKVLAQI
jgi:hypothetical protein